MQKISKIAGSALALALFITPVAANPAAAAPPATPVSAAQTAAPSTERASSSTPNTSAASKPATTSHSKAPGAVQPTGVPSWIRKTVLWALRFAKDSLPAAIRPYAGKLISVLETLDSWQRGPIVFGLMQVGVPYDVAMAAADWVIFFVGI